MWLLKLGLALLAGYMALLLAIYLAQGWLLFPAWMGGGAVAPLPSGAQRLGVTVDGGERLTGLHLPPMQPMAEGPPPLLIGFGGNAWNADNMAIYLRGLYPQAEIATFHYRGYGPSEGRPSASALLADALVIHDFLARRFPGRLPVAVGISLGSGVAAHLAAERRLAGLILVSPFDSLALVAQDHYWWLPVRQLFRHPMESAASLRGLATPVALIAAERDSIIRPPRTAALRAAISNPVLDRVIAGADHNDLFNRPDFVAAMQEALRLILVAEAKP
ncbi:MAG: alpha/beta fold hydrolase [Alphaproteobacteria bacterium]|nr:alpha/beta fold hydrolase [Alphaproteobacteria bacterium]